MKCQKEKFQLQGKIAYINCAYMSPLMKKVEKAGKKGIASKRKPYSVSPEDFFHDGETARKLFSKIINNPNPQRAVIIPSVSYGLANVINNLPKRQGKIIIAEEQFPSNVYPWMANRDYEVVHISAPAQGQRGEGWNQKILEAIDEETAAVAIGHIHWADGTLFDLPAIRMKTSQNDAALIIDGTQSIGALPFDVEAIKPDALVCAGYKWLLGPYSIGMAYYGEMFDHGQPIEHNWINRKGAENFGGLVNYVDEFQPGALRYEVGEHSNFILLPMLLVAMKQVLKWTPEAIQNYCSDLVDPFLDEIKEMGGLVEDSAFRSSHLFGIRLPSTSMERVKEQLHVHRVSISTRGDALRVSPHVYNQPKDMRRLVAALRAAVDTK